MDGADFDHLIRSLPSRRRLLIAILGGGLAAGVVRSAPAGAAPCLPAGAKCDPTNAAACCTGTCKKHNGKHKCAPAGEALGCTTSKETNICETGMASPCPDNQAGFCIVARTKRKQQPLCLAAADCSFDCTSDADCVDHFGGPPTIRCIKHCNLCASTTSCVVPLTGA
jgi:hypothetical protein